MSGLLFPPPSVPAEALLELRLVCEPAGKGRGRASRSGRKCPHCRLQTGSLIVRTPDKTRKLQDDIGKTVGGIMRRRGLEKLDGALMGLVVGMWPRPKKPPFPKYEGRQWRPSRPDFDNFAKLVFDAISGIAYRDDALIVDGRAQTLYAAAWEEPMIEIYLWRAPMFPPELDRSSQPPEEE